MTKKPEKIEAFGPMRLSRGALRKRYPGLSAETARDGVIRYRVKISGQKVTVSGQPGTQEFDAQYTALRSGTPYRRPVRAVIRASASLATVPPRRFAQMLSKARERAVKKGLPYDISLDWLRDVYVEQGGRCALSGIAFTFDRSRRAFGPSIDRIDCAQGYTADNCRLVLVMVNLARLSWDDDEFLAMCRGVVRRADRNKTP